MIGRAALFLGVSVLAGLLVAGLALPFVGTAGVLARTTAEEFEELPSVLETPVLPETSTILAADGTLIARVFTENRVVVTLEQVAPVMRDALVAVEDSRFYEHNGVDVQGSLRAAFANREAGEIQQGGSTITQQYVKNILIASAQTEEEIRAARAPTVSRKLREMSYAIGLEKRLSKDQILEGYLNISYFGAGAYGVEAAARKYFTKSASALTLVEAATLAGIVQQPVGFDPTRNPEASQSRRDEVLDRMRQNDYINAADYQAAVATPLASYLKVSPTPNGCATALAPYFCDYVTAIIRSDPSFGATQAERDNLLKRGGLTITTTIDLKAQTAAQKAVNTAIPPNDPSQRAAASVSVEPGTGAIKAMAQNRTWGTAGPGVTTYNYAVDRAYGGTIGMQAGSTFKVFTLAAAIEQGIPINRKTSVPPKKTFTGFTNCTTGARYEPYPVGGGVGGTFDLRTGTARSVNTFYVDLELEIGQCRPTEMASSLGVATGAGQPIEPVPSFTLGSATVSPLSMAEAYATFAARGVHCEARAIRSIVDRDGIALPVPANACSQAIEKGVADAVTDVLTSVIDGPDPRRTGEGLSLGRPAAGKTGTTNDNAAVWFVGYTPDLATAVWCGDPRGGTAYPMANVRIKGRYYKQVFGATLPGPIWKATMLGALEGVPETKFPELDPRTVKGVLVKVPNLAGRSPAEAQGALARAGLTLKVADGTVRSAQPAGTVAVSSPGAGATVSSGTVVTVRLSDGTAVAPPPPPPTTPVVPPIVPVVPPPPAPGG